MPRDSSSRTSYKSRNDHRNGDGSEPSKRKPRKKVKRNEAQEDAEAEKDTTAGSGVNKIKAAIRQTKRLLAKEKILASARTDAERRLTALEDELNRREFSQKERKNSTRYHKVRFFERQKLTRRIGKLKKQLDEDKDKEDLQADLKEARVLLNYVLHFPMSQKYVALYPSQGPSPLAEEDEKEDEESKKSRHSMRKVKQQIVEAMEKGELSQEPEVELENRSKEEGSSVPKRQKAASLAAAPRKKQKKDDDEKVDPNANNLADDDFFA
ncbi:uncharacterized protein FA14DRAFT_160276 [Meira miltonrushii]|uniref:rRNA-processing protein EFG1 n=1 Tax=Meira miltonrushii TaxID=1280837 RepID=A0A316VB26_9BASI|nr:uncharacterized protein FA14DRAFT_160276 [Meira miltonrushii]PWN34849.1 hypothetical protein FA14DRAFT_160276 [Meira miltonrushii]